MPAPGRTGWIGSVGSLASRLGTSRLGRLWLGQQRPESQQDSGQVDARFCGLTMMFAQKSVANLHGSTRTFECIVQVAERALHQPEVVQSGCHLRAFVILWGVLMALSKRSGRKTRQRRGFVWHGGGQLARFEQRLTHAKDGAKIMSYRAG